MEALAGRMEKWSFVLSKHRVENQRRLRQASECVRAEKGFRHSTSGGYLMMNEISQSREIAWQR